MLGNEPLVFREGEDLIGPDLFKIEVVDGEVVAVPTSPVLQRALDAGTCRVEWR